MYAITSEIDPPTFVPSVLLMTPRKLTSGSDVWSCDYLHIALMYLRAKFDAYTFDHSGDIDIFQNTLWQNSILLTFPSRPPSLLLESNTKENLGKTADGKMKNI